MDWHVKQAVHLQGLKGFNTSSPNDSRTKVSAIRGQH